MQGHFCLGHIIAILDRLHSPPVFRRVSGRASFIAPRRFRHDARGRGGMQERPSVRAAALKSLDLKFLTDKGQGSVGRGGEEGRGAAKRPLSRKWRFTVGQRILYGRLLGQLTPTPVMTEIKKSNPKPFTRAPSSAIHKWNQDAITPPTFSVPPLLLITVVAHPVCASVLSDLLPVTLLVLTDTSSYMSVLHSVTSIAYVSSAMMLRRQALPW
jgi:hypothetical protein